MVPVDSGYRLPWAPIVDLAPQRVLQRRKSPRRRRLTALLPLLALAGACMPSGWAPAPEDLPRGNWHFLKGEAEIACEDVAPYWTDQEGNVLDFDADPQEGLLIRNHGDDTEDCVQQVFTFTDSRHAFIAPQTPCGSRLMVLEAELELLPRQQVLYFRRYVDISPSEDQDSGGHCRIFQSGYLVPDEPIAPAPEEPVVEPEPVYHDTIEGPVDDEPGGGFKLDEPKLELIPRIYDNGSGFVLVVPDAY